MAVISIKCVTARGDYFPSAICHHITVV